MHNVIMPLPRVKVTVPRRFNAVRQTATIFSQMICIFTTFPSFLPVPHTHTHTHMLSLRKHPVVGRVDEGGIQTLRGLLCTCGALGVYVAAEVGED